MPSRPLLLASSTAGSKACHDVVVAPNLSHRLRDGVQLAADVYFPASGVDRVTEPCPVLLMRTPYDKTATAGVGRFYAQRGYIVVLEDVRGRYASEGEFFPFAGEGPDGADTVGWLRDQCWCNGKIGTLGGSYCAATQSALASLNPPGLAAMVIHFGPSSYYHSSMRHNGVLELRFLVYAFTMAASSREASAQPGLRQVLSDAAAHAWDYLKSGPIRPGTTPLRLVPSYERWAVDILTRGSYDAFWRSPGFGPLPYYEDHADVPTLYVGGWYDTYTRGTVENFRALSSRKREPVHLLMGPWTHGQIDSDRAGDGVYAPEGKIDFEAVRLRWFDQWLKGVDMGLADSDPVTYFVMGGEQQRAVEQGGFSLRGTWCGTSQWPPPEGGDLSYYLSPAGTLATSVPERNGLAATTFAFDPSDPVPTIGGSLSAMPLPAGAFDQRNDPRFPESGGNGLALCTRPDVLVFVTDAFDHALTIAGPVVVHLYVSTDGTDTDFTAKLIDIRPPSASHPGGLAVNLTDSVARLRYRNGFEFEELAEPGKVYELRIELFPTAYTFLPGHRLRLDISSSNYPRFELNPNTGEALGQHRRTRVAHNTVYHCREYPSSLSVWAVPTGEAAVVTE